MTDSEKLFHDGRALIELCIRKRCEENPTEEELNAWRGMVRLMHQVVFAEYRKELEAAEKVMEMTLDESDIRDWMRGDSHGATMWLRGSEP